MAVAPEVLEAGAGAEEGAAAGARGAESQSQGGPWQAVSQASGQLRRTPGAARAAYASVSSPSAAAATVTKLIWAVALGLIVLEIAAQATGQTWSFSLDGFARGQRPQKGAYLPLYAGQASAASALPGVFSGELPQQSPSTNLSGRAGGNLAMG